jgi:multidrug resistance efflux pump
MSELHPSAPTLRKGRRSHRIRQVIDHWPLLVWGVVLGIAVFGYSQGIVFDRMNGVVDVYQESISPTEDGTFLKLAPGIETGKEVNAGDVIAEMDQKMIMLEISRFKALRKIRAISSEQNIREELVKLKDKFWEADNDLKDITAELGAKRTRLQALSSARSDELKTIKADLESEIRELEERETRRAEKVEFFESAVTAQADMLNRATDVNEDEIPMDAEDQEKLKIIQERLKRTTLTVRRDGKVDRILKEPGEYVKAGESIVKVVADPTHILGFLPQQEVAAVKANDEVWITSAIDRYTTFKSTVLDLSPRIDSVRDAASPLPNQSVRGRTILIAYPTESGFLPGQPVIIHLKPPGELSLMTKLSNLFKK